MAAFPVSGEAQFRAVDGAMPHWSHMEYFGFSGLAVTVPDSDPRALGKQVAYKVHCDSMKAASPIVQLIKKTMLDGKVGIAGVHLIVDDHRGSPAFLRKGL